MKTIAIPAYNEEKSIQKSINSIIPQLDKEDEILIVTSGCTDDTVSIVKAIQKKDKRIKLLTQKNKEGKASAINIILKKAKGKIIVFTDADDILEKNAIKNLLKNFGNESIGAISGRICSYKTESFFDRMQDFAWEQLDKKKRKETRENRFFALNGYLYAVRKGAIDKIETKYLGDDPRIGWLVRQKGYGIVYEPNAIVYVQASQNINDYIKQKTRCRLAWWQATEYGVKLNDIRNKRHLKNLFTSLYAWPYLTLEVYCWLKAYILYKRNILDWEPISSSKI